MVDIQGQLVNINKQILKEFALQYSGIIENILLSNDKSFNTFQNLTDERMTSFARSFASLYNGITDLSLITPNKLPEDAINTSMNGRMKLSSVVYDSEDYYEVFQDFQPLTQLS
jgi:hypothetical protein